jgi:adenylate kinase family enzyme
MKTKRALSVHDLLSFKAKVMEFEGRWEASFGCPEMSGCWLVWGESGSGKTTFAMQLCRYLTRFGRVAYNSLEEGMSESLRSTVAAAGMEDCSRRFIILDREPIVDRLFVSKWFIKKVKEFLERLVHDNLSSQAVAQVIRLIESRRPKPSKDPECLWDRLERKKSPDIVVIDSIQYAGLDKNTAKELTERFPRKLFIFVSHADGKNPAGRPANAIRFHANVKLWVEGYRIPAPVSRFKNGECAPFTVWTEGAERYWGNTIKN